MVFEFKHKFKEYVRNDLNLPLEQTFGIQTIVFQKLKIKCYFV